MISFVDCNDYTTKIGCVRFMCPAYVSRLILIWNFIVSFYLVRRYVCGSTGLYHIIRGVFDACVCTRELALCDGPLMMMITITTERCVLFFFLSLLVWFISCVRTMTMTTTLTVYTERACIVVAVCVEIGFRVSSKVASHGSNSPYTKILTNSRFT